MTGPPPAEVAIDAGLVRRLLADQHPDLAGLPLTPAGEGWDNAMFRLGDRLAVRLPRRASAAAQIRREQAWLPLIAPALPLPVPVPLREGQPGQGYPWYWSVLPWFDGETALDAPPDPGEVLALARFLRALHVPAPPEIPVHPQRAGPLAELDAEVAPLIRDAGAAVCRAWAAGAAAAPAGPPVWFNGDLHPGNLIVRGGRIVAVIDWGNLMAGDPATDLAVLWMLVDAGPREAALAAYGATEAERLRAAARAIAFLARFLAPGTLPDREALARAALARLAG